MEKLITTPQASKAVRQLANWKKSLLVGGVVLGIFALLNIGIWAVYYGRTYPGVKLGGQDVGNITSSAIAHRLQVYTANYSLKMQVEDQTQEVTGESLGLTFEQPSNVKAALRAGKSQWLPLYGLFYTWQNGASDLSYKLDSQKLEREVAGLVGTASLAPTDAKLIIEGETVRVEADKPGQGIDPKVLAALIQEKIRHGQRQASIAERATRASITIQQVETMVPIVQQRMKLPLSVQINGKVFSPGVAQIGSWLVVVPDKTGKLVVDTKQDAITAYVASIATQVDVVAVNKQINMVNGEVRTVNEGKNGSALDKDGLAKVLMQAVTSGRDTAVTGAMTTVAFKTRTNNSIDLNGKYIEINLSRQHLWAYNDKQLVFESAITSGATGAGLATIQGLFSIKAKQTNRNLNGRGIGYDYNVFVNYWMPFSGNYGMHDASWRSSFGGSDYYYGGSHGCVNLPTDAAAWVYNFVMVGTPVWVHS